MVPVGITIPQGKKAAATVTFFPGNPFTPGDTIDPLTTTPVVNKINAFAIYDFKDLDKIENHYYYDNGMLCTQDIRYDYNTQGWGGSYIAGNAYTSGYYYLDMSFKLTSSDVGVNENNSTQFEMGLFPSVITEYESAVLQIQTKLIGNATISLTDVSGKTVTAMKTTLQSGTNKISLSSQSLTAGIYFVRVEMNGIAQVLKLVKL